MSSSPPSQAPDVELLDFEMLDMEDLPPLPSIPVKAQTPLHEKELSAALAVSKQMGNNAQVHFHLGLLGLRLHKGENALKAFQRCLDIYRMRLEKYKSSHKDPPQNLYSSITCVLAHMVRAVEMTNAATPSHVQSMAFLTTLPKDIFDASNVRASPFILQNALALHHLSAGDFDTSKSMLHSILKRLPDRVDVMNNLGLCELGLGNEEEALLWFQKALLCESSNIEALCNYGLVMLRQGLIDSALKLYSSAVEAGIPEVPGYAFVWGGLAVCRAARGQFLPAELAALTAELSSDPINRARFSVLCLSIRVRRMIHVPLKDTRVLSQDVTPAAIAPHATPSVSGAMVVGQGNPAEGMDFTVTEAGMVISAGPIESNVDRKKKWFGDIQLTSTDPWANVDLAVRRVREIARGAQDSSVTATLGVLLRMRHEFGPHSSTSRNHGVEAGERLIEALEMDKSNTLTWTQLSLLQLSTGEYSQARICAFQQVLEEPSDVMALNCAAVACMLSNQNRDSAKVLNRALGIAKGKYNFQCSDDDELSEERVLPPQGPMSPSHSSKGAVDKSQIDDTGRQLLAMLYSNIGTLRRQGGPRNCGNALRAYRIALQLGGERAHILNNIALLYISIGELETAATMLGHALRVDPKFECALSNNLKLQALRSQNARKAEEDGVMVDGGRLDVDTPMLGSGIVPVRRRVGVNKADMRANGSSNDQSSGQEEEDGKESGDDGCEMST